MYYKCKKKKILDSNSELKQLKIYKVQIVNRKIL